MHDFVSVRTSLREPHSRESRLRDMQAAARIVSPVLAGWMYELSTTALSTARVLPPGALPFIVVGSLTGLTAPLPLLLRRATR